MLQSSQPDLSLPTADEFIKDLQDKSKMLKEQMILDFKKRDFQYDKERMKIEENKKIAKDILNKNWALYKDSIMTVIILNIKELMKTAYIGNTEIRLFLNRIIFNIKDLEDKHGKLYYCNFIYFIYGELNKLLCGNDSDGHQEYCWQIRMISEHRYKYRNYLGNDEFGKDISIIVSKVEKRDDKKKSCSIM